MEAGTMKGPLRVVVIGGVACGPKTASRLKRLKPDAQITLVDKGNVLSYGACGLPYYVSGDVGRIDALVETPAGVKRDPVFFKKVKGFDALTGTEVVRIDREHKSVEAVCRATGEKTLLPYDKLVLATGARPIRPALPGIDLKGVCQMHHLEDGEKVKALVEKRNVRSAVIVGSGLIGMEMAEALTIWGVKVTLVELLPYVMGLLLDPEMSLLAMKHLSAKGVSLRMAEEVTGFVGDSDGALRKVTTSRGEIDAEMALVAIGVRPNSELAVQSGLAVDPRGGILVNQFCQTSDPEIYAGGDCVSNACLHGLHGTTLFAPQGSTANKHGRIIANHIAGTPEAFPGVLGTVICKVFDITVARSGLSESHAKKLGYRVETVVWAGTDLPHYYPESAFFCIKLIVDTKTRRLIGFQAVGEGRIDKRLDVAVASMSFRATVDEIAQLDLGYAPPFSPPLDPLITAAHIAQNKLDGITRAISPIELKERLDRGDTEIVLLDVRSPAEREKVRLPYEERTVHIPLGALRERLAELPRDKEIVPFCKVSLRGYEAERILAAGGFQRVAFLDGGIVGWPFEVVEPGNR